MLVRKHSERALLTLHPGGCSCEILGSLLVVSRGEQEAPFAGVGYSRVCRSTSTTRSNKSICQICCGTCILLYT